MVSYLLLEVMYIITLSFLAIRSKKKKKENPGVRVLSSAALDFDFIQIMVIFTCFQC